MMLTAIIVRHGNTFAPDEPPRRIGVRTDIPLVDSGRAQARALAALFTREEPFDRVLAGPLLRTQQTARLIVAAQSNGTTIETCDWLAEIDHGSDEDRTEDDVRARIGTPMRWHPRAGSSMPNAASMLGAGYWNVRQAAS